MKSLVIAEKPSVGRDIARVLHCSKPSGGALEGDQYVVTWALGHLVTLADPEEYDKKYQKWDMDTLPMMPEKMQLVVIRQTGKQFQTVKTQLYRKDIGEIIIATDAGREGELVARWILEKANCHKPIRRLWISSVTDKAIREGFAHLEDGRKYQHLYEAAVCRAEADWLVGMNGTRALTCKHNAQLSCGRVQTPTLAMIAKREAQIREFVPQEYYGISLRDGQVCWTWQDKKSGGYRSFDKERMEKICRELKGKQLTVTEVKESKSSVPSPGLYDLTELQRDASRKFGYSAKQTLNIMQQLYEHHKVLTYPRTDSRYISADVAETLKERLRAISIGPYKKLAGSLIMQPLRLNKSFVDDKKVSDHHAIIPTEQFVQMDKMSTEERRIYDLVVRRFLSVLHPPCVYMQTSLKGEAAGENFAARGKVMLEQGWRVVYEQQDKEENEETEESLREQTLPVMKKGETRNIQKMELTKGKTKPPAYFTEATLLSAMENPVKYMESRDAQAVKTLGETGGLGTVATRADIIEKLFNSFLMEKRGNEIHLTGKARQLLTLVPEDLKKPELTASWEMELAKIAKGAHKEQVFIKDIESYTKELIQDIKTSDGTFRHDNLTNTKCPHCGKRMLSVKGKNSRMLVCQDRECGYRETIARTSNARCPNCHKRMELIKKGDSETFVCSCGYKEKLEAFKNRRAKEGAGVSKRDVQKYLKKQQQQNDEPVNNAFAQALAGLKLDK